MINCPICKTPNHHLQTVCVSCGGFVQQKIDTINLFEMIWKIIESPRKAFRSIALARNKNYVLFQGALIGYPIVGFIFWYLNVGDSAHSFAEIFVAGLFISPFVGLIVFFLHLLFARLVIRSFGVTTKFRNLMAVVAYTSFPLILSAILILPIELITFGMFLFTKAPNPFTLLPKSAIFLFGLDTMLGIWSLILYVISIQVLLEVKIIKSLLISLIGIGITAITIAGLLSLIPVK